MKNKIIDIDRLKIDSISMCEYETLVRICQVYEIANKLIDISVDLYPPGIDQQDYYFLFLFNRLKDINYLAISKSEYDEKLDRLKVTYHWKHDSNKHSFTLDKFKEGVEPCAKKLVQSCITRYLKLQNREIEDLTRQIEDIEKRKQDIQDKTMKVKKIYTDNGIISEE